MNKIALLISGLFMAVSVCGICIAANYTEKKELYKRNVMNDISIISGMIGMSLFALTITNCF